jgi:hypothetical protein
MKETILCVIRKGAEMLVTYCQPLNKDFRNFASEIRAEDSMRYWRHSSLNMIIVLDTDLHVDWASSSEFSIAGFVLCRVV